MPVSLKTFLAGLFTWLSFCLSSQNETSKWYFGNHAGLDFSTNPPTVLTNGVINTLEGCASIANASGTLLFYTDGVTVFNQAHAAMANGTGLNGNSSTTQSAIIVKKPGNNPVYYIFTLAAFTGSNGLCYSEVDMSLAAGMGSVTVKNFTLFTPSCEKLTAVRHCNGIDAWVLSHDWNSANFRAYLVTQSGVNLTPVLSGSGPSLNTTIIRSLGQMKISPNGKKLGLSIYDNLPNSFQLHDFDAATGLVSNPLVLDSSIHNYGCEFSPDGSKFYGGGPYGQFLQWDLCAGTPSAIVASQYTFQASSYSPGAFQLAMDGKIYVARSGSKFISAINAPNLPGLLCNYIDTAQSLGTSTCLIGLPNFINSFFKPAMPPFTYSITCAEVSFTPPPASTLNAGCNAVQNSVSGQLWLFGDPGSGAANSSTLSTPVHTYPAAGNYTVKLALYSTCSSDTVKQIVSIPNTLPLLTVAGTFTMCKGDQRTYTVSGASSYSWSSSANTTTVVLSPTITTGYTVSGTATNSCKGVKVFTVTVNKCLGIDQAEDAENIYKIYPNPSAGNLVLETEYPVKLTVLNQTGTIVWERSFTSGKHPVDLRDLADGIYTAKLSGTRGVKMIKLVITE